MLKVLEQKYFDEIYALMEKSFSADELRSKSEQKALLKNPKYRIYGVTEDSANIKAFVSVYDLGDFAFIEHFAVSPKYRNLGLGSLLLTKLKSTLKCRICLEVELPENELAKRRIRFYIRNGFFLNEYEYIQPPISRDKQSVPLLLMSSDAPLSHEEFENVKKILYREVYKHN